MPARYGQEVIDSLRANPAELYHRGQRVDDVTTEPGIRNGVLGLASHYDQQHEHADLMLFESPLTGDLVSRSFAVPKTRDELTKVGDAMKASADHSCGMQGRHPDYLNRTMAAFGTATAFLNAHLKGGGDNAQAYFERARENDLALTHTLINPQANRAVGPSKQRNPFLAARIKEESDSGITVRGARMLATLPISDEILVFPSTVLRNPAEDALTPLRLAYRVQLRGSSSSAESRSTTTATASTIRLAHALRNSMPSLFSMTSLYRGRECSSIEMCKRVMWRTNSPQPLRTWHIKCFARTSRRPSSC